MEKRFIADSMLGRLAKWLRVMGYDTHYQPFYMEGALLHLVREGRLLISCHRPTVDEYTNSLFIHSDYVKGQLQEMRSKDVISADRSKWFSRCLICNVVLNVAEPEAVRESVPEYIFYQNIAEIRSCPSCGRYFWPGSHRQRMIMQLEEWGFLM